MPHLHHAEDIQAVSSSTIILPLLLSCSLSNAVRRNKNIVNVLLHDITDSVHAQDLPVIHLHCSYAWGQTFSRKMCSSHSYLSNSILIFSRRSNASSGISFSSLLLFSHRLPRFLYSGQYPCGLLFQLNFHCKYLISSKKRTFSARRQGRFSLFV